MSGDDRGSGTQEATREAGCSQKAASVRGPAPYLVHSSDYATPGIPGFNLPAQRSGF